MVIRGQVQPVFEKYEKIRCFTCEKDLPGKSVLKRHKGHEVHYTDKNGRIAD